MSQEQQGFGNAHRPLAFLKEKICFILATYSRKKSKKSLGRPTIAFPGK
jgi:hypothetical protein